MEKKTKTKQQLLFEIEELRGKPVEFWGQACNIGIIENISRNLYNFFLQLPIIFLHANPREMGQID
jgi:hypothetical protein